MKGKCQFKFIQSMHAYHPFFVFFFGNFLVKYIVGTLMPGSGNPVLTLKIIFLF